jgi:hypothetical protein
MIAYHVLGFSKRSSCIRFRTSREGTDDEDAHLAEGADAVLIPAAAAAAPAAAILPKHRRRSNPTAPTKSPGG